jgi:hypothetical protein
METLAALLQMRWAESRYHSIRVTSFPGRSGFTRSQAASERAVTNPRNRARSIQPHSSHHSNQGLGWWTEIRRRKKLNS